MKTYMLRTHGPNEWAEHNLDFASITMVQPEAQQLLVLKELAERTRAELKLRVGSIFEPSIEISFFDTVGVKFYSHAKVQDDDLDGKIESLWDEEVQEGEYQGLPEPSRIESARIVIEDEGVRWQAYEKHGIHLVETAQLGWDLIEQAAKLPREEE